MRIAVAPDSFGGTLSAAEAAAAIARGWRRTRPDDEVVERPLSDGGEGLLDVVAGPGDTWVATEVAGPLGHPVEAAWLLRADGTAVIESARACGLHLLAPEHRDPSRATTWGVGQLLDAAWQRGCPRILVGLGGSATVDGGAGALSALGYRLTVADGSGLKIGGADLGRVARAERGWARDWSGREVVLLADVDVPLADAARRFGPQKGADAVQVASLAAALEVWADVAERDLDGPIHRDDPGTGAAGGLGFGLGRALPGARMVPGARAVADLVGSDATFADADLVITGEGRLDATTTAGKVPDLVRRTHRGPVAAIVGQHVGDAAHGFVDVEVAAPRGAGSDPAEEVALAAARLAGRWR